MKISTVHVVLAFFILFLLASNIFFLYNINIIREDLAKQKTNSENEKNQLAVQVTELNKTIHDRDQDIQDLNSQLETEQLKLIQTQNLLTHTQNELNATRAELTNKSISLEEAQIEFATLQTEVENISLSINESIQWFKTNSHMSPTLEFFPGYVTSKCIQGSDTLNLACIDFFMEKRLEFFYKDESPDKLNTLDEMVAKGGGDCEDYSLFLKAVLNDIKKTEPHVKLMGWTTGSSKFTVYEGSDTAWYYKNAQAKPLGLLEDLNPVIICYTTFYTDEQLRGHCVVGLPSAKIESAADLYKLNGAQTFEPQDGSYTGMISTDLFLCGGEDCGKSTKDIIIVITDDDFYKMENGEWQGFSLALNNIQEFQAKLGQP
ncbi:Uncharacterised protein [Candidatus Bilamarchaeum dharawalense]|uniref:Transglutaminase-like domain-containing protein n=1 Tax=Candidatus Bilamarchaeum dharawalense TaxID=2885759 RepID=A0A5E4LWY2_9ARCH|nr:Uncharacterised protein [Candidatus Bilamarchaeum dharawalense]